MSQLRQRSSELERRGIAVLVVSFEPAERVEHYLEDVGSEFPVAIDQQRALYHRYQMDRAGFADVWGPSTWIAYARALRRGHRLQRSDADVQQRGGDVLTDPDGVVRVHHVGKGPADRPDIEILLERVIPKP